MDLGDLVLAEVQGSEALGDFLERGMGDVAKGIGVEGQIFQARTTVGEQVSEKEGKLKVEH